jgi:glycosyltransferase involved in cell wall biosynthesis
MGEASRKRAVEHFSWKAIAQEVLALYERLV